MDYSTERKHFWRQQIKQHIVEAFGNKCQCCGQQYDNCCYDLHHLNPEEKQFTISASQFNGAKSWLKIRDEVLKCALVCANCHRKIHNGVISQPEKSAFDSSYYEWELTTYKQVSKDMQPLDANYICPKCGGKKGASSTICNNCQKKFEVSREELKNLIYTQSFVSIGKKFGVSDNAIKKRCKTFNLPYLRSEIKKYSKEEWEKI